MRVLLYELDEEQLLEIKELLARYFADKATVEMDKLWDEKKWDNETMNEWSKERIWGMVAW